MSIRDDTNRIAMVWATKETVAVLNKYGIRMASGGKADDYLGDLLMIYEKDYCTEARLNCMTFLDDVYNDIPSKYTSWFGSRDVNMLELHTICRAIKEDSLDELLAECDRHSEETD